MESMCGDNMKVEIVQIPDEEIVIKVAAIAKTSYHSENYQSFVNMDFDEASTFLKNLIAKGHEGVIEPLVFTFNIQEVSRILSHQLVRHRIASYLQKSLRRERKITENDLILPETEMASVYKKAMTSAIKIYEYLIANGEDPDDARRIIPMGVSTEITMTMNARSLRNFLKQRLDKAASWEIRKLALTIAVELVANKLGFLIEDILLDYNKQTSSGD